MNDAAIDTTVAIEAPEQIRFRYRLAGPSLRAAAHLVDLLIIALIFAGIVIVASLLSLPFALSGEQGAERAATGVVLLTVFALQWGYFTLFEALRAGRTPGKSWLSLRVIKSEIGRAHV